MRSASVTRWLSLFPGLRRGEAGAFIKPGDDNSKFYTKPDEPPLPHPAEVLEELKKEMPDTPVEELVKLADARVQEAIEAVKVRREAEAKADEEKAEAASKAREAEAAEEAKADEDAEVKEE